MNSTRINKNILTLALLVSTGGMHASYKRKLNFDAVENNALSSSSTSSTSDSNKKAKTNGNLPLNTPAISAHGKHIASSEQVVSASGTYVAASELESENSENNLATLAQFPRELQKIIIGYLNFWELKKGFQAHNDTIRGVAISTCGRFLATSDTEKLQVKLWDFQDLRQHSLLKPAVGDKEQENPDQFMSLAISPNSNYVAAVAEMGKLLLWERASGALVGQAMHGKPRDNYYRGRIRFAADNKYLISSVHEQLAESIIFDVDAKQMWDYVHGSDWTHITCVDNHIAYSPVLSQVETNIWDSNKKLVGTIFSHRSAPKAFSPNGQLLALGHENGTVKIFSNHQATRSWQEVVALADPDGEEQNDTRFVTFSHDGLYVAWATRKYAYVSDLRTGRPVILYDAGFRDEQDSDEGLEYDITNICFAANNKNVILELCDPEDDLHMVCIFDVVTGDLLQKIETAELTNADGQGGRLTACGVSPSGRYMAAGFSHGFVQAYRNQMEEIEEALAAASTKK